MNGSSKPIVCGSVEETLNDLPEKKAQELTQAAKYERTELTSILKNGATGLCRAENIHTYMWTVFT